NSVGNTVDAHIDSSTVDAQKGLAVTATETSNITALTVGAAVAISVGVSGSSIPASGAGAGASTTNTIANTVQADIKNSQTRDDAIRTETGKVTVAATDSATTKATADGV